MPVGVTTLPIVGAKVKRIKTVRNDEHDEDELVIELDNGITIHALRDPEGNGLGTLIGRYGETEFYLENESNLEEDAYERLRKWRSQVARMKQVPPYIIATDSVLRLLASQHPTTLESLGQVRGFGPAKVQTYGAEILAALGPRALCYSDHNHDIELKGSCDMCKGTTPDPVVS